jgi:hypothetical protein
MSDDLFEDAPAAPTNSYPSVKQLATGDKSVTVVYPGKEPVIKETTGRLCIFRPTSKARKVPDTKNPGKFKDQCTADVILLTGPPITEKFDKDDEVTGTFDPPLVPGDVLVDMWHNNKLIVGSLMLLGKNDEHPDGNPIGKMTVGRIMLLPPKVAGGNKAWAIGTAKDPKQKAEDIKLASAWVKAHPAPDMFEATH